jgi:hypothetical protein
MKRGATWWLDTAAWGTALLLITSVYPLREYYTYLNEFKSKGHGLPFVWFQLDFLRSMEIAFFPHKLAVDLLLCVLAAYFLRIFRERLRRNHRVQHSECAACGYSLTGNRSGVCPECGKSITKPVRA